MLKKLESMKT